MGGMRADGTERLAVGSERPVGKERRMVGDAWLKSAVEMGGILESCRCELALWSRKQVVLHAFYANLYATLYAFLRARRSWTSGSEHECSGRWGTDIRVAQTKVRYG